MYLKRQNAAKGDAAKIQTHDSVSIPKYGLNSKTATTQAHNEKTNCLSDNPKKLIRYNFLFLYLFLFPMRFPPLLFEQIKIATDNK